MTSEGLPDRASSEGMDVTAGNQRVVLPQTAVVGYMPC